jgi:hypothetical protein
MDQNAKKFATWRASGGAWVGTANPYPVHRPACGGAHLTEAESSRRKGGTGVSRVHRQVHGGAPPQALSPLSGATALIHPRVAKLG